MMSIDGPPSQDVTTDARSSRSSIGSRRGATPAGRPDINAPLPALIPRVMTEKDFARFELTVGYYSKQEHLLRQFVFVYRSTNGLPGAAAPDCK